MTLSETPLVRSDPPPDPSDPTAAAPDRIPVWAGALAGLVAAAAGLAAGAFVAGLGRSLVSPVVAVGDRIIDRVPLGLKEWAIDTFGTSDKTALVTGIVLTLAVLAAVVGILAFRRRRPTFGLVAALVLGLVGVWAGGTGRQGSAARAVPGAVAGLVAAAVLTVLHRRSRPRRDTSPMPVPLGSSGPVPVPLGSSGPVPVPLGSSGPVPVPLGSSGPVPAGVTAGRAVAVPSGFDRRRFLAAAGVVAVGSAAAGGLAGSLRTRYRATVQRAGIGLPAAKRSGPTLPTDPALTIPGLSPLITPTNRFYRIDTALVVPSIAVSSWQMEIRGKVDRPITFTYDQLLQRDLVELDATIACVSNEVGGDLIGNARWLGVRLSELLDEAGVHDDADQIVGRSVDDFTAGFPIAVLAESDAIVAIGMNGEPLPTKHGFPARLIVPGLYGYVSATKWLSAIELTRFDEFAGYWVPRGWSRLGPIKTQSRIDTPSQGDHKPAGRVAIGGVAWAPQHGITKVEVQVDDGPWRSATLGPEIATTTWRQWWIDWDASAGKHQLRVRATDATGATQTEERTDVAPDGATGWHTIRVTIDAA